MEAKPVVDGIEADVGGSAQVVRVDLLSEFGATLARRYGVEFTPTFLLFDRRGTLVGPVRLDRAAIVARLRDLGS